MKNAIIQTVPAAKELHRVPGFDPMKHLQNGVLGLPYKRLWFRLACPDGRLLLEPLRVTDQMAIFEAKVFLRREDAAPHSSFTSTKTVQETRSYIRAAQDEALSMALDNAGFGIQLCDIAADDSDGAAKASVQSQPAPAPVRSAPSPVEEPVKQELPAPVEQPSPKPQEPVTAEQPSEALLETQPPKVVDITPPEVSEPAPEPETASPGYTDETPVEEILQLMSLDDARAVVVNDGTCKGWTMGQIAEKRPPSLKFYTTQFCKCGNTGTSEQFPAHVLTANFRHKRVAKAYNIDGYSRAFAPFCDENLLANPHTLNYSEVPQKAAAFLLLEVMQKAG